ncbi:MAG: hypothetical protein LBK25_09520 [Treponema sp.]|nr:hypothetical protein [Treponema sp.]
MSKSLRNGVRHHILTGDSSIPRSFTISNTRRVFKYFTMDVIKKEVLLTPHPSGVGRLHNGYCPKGVAAVPGDSGERTVSGTKA